MPRPLWRAKAACALFLPALLLAGCGEHADAGRNPPPAASADRPATATPPPVPPNRETIAELHVQRASLKEMPAEVRLPAIDRLG